MSIGGPTVGASINLELNLSATANSSIGQANFRELAKVPNGQIKLSDFYGKSRVTQITIYISTREYTLSPSIVPGYIAGSTSVELVINPGAYVYSDDITKPGLLVTGFVAGDSVKIVNNGYIIGCGGAGGIYLDAGGQAGGPAISLAFNVTIENSTYIAGGGGGGGGGGWTGYSYGVGTYYSFGGGGAGGGLAGSSAGGAPGQKGADGITFPSPPFPYPTVEGGGGGRILLGDGGQGATTHFSNTGNGKGGGAGGGGAFYFYSVSGYYYSICGGGGGGWGASGGRCFGGPNDSGYRAGNGGAANFVGQNATAPTLGPPGGAGGKAIQLNGHTATISGFGSVWGAVS